jgi:hypothetical protein
MRKFLLVLVLLTACVIGVGFYLGWFGISTARDTAGKTGVNLMINQDKIKSDTERARQKAREVVNRGADQGEKK